MKKVFFTLGLFCIGAMTWAQSPVETKVDALEKKVDELVARMDALSMRLVEVEQLNVRLRKALDFGKPITTVEGEYGITYHIIAIEGNRAEKTIKVRLQVKTQNDSNNLMLSYAFQMPSIVDVNGDRYEASGAEIGNKEFLEIHKDVPVNASITFTNIEPDSVVDIKLLKIVATVDYGHSDDILFKNLKVDWK